MPRIKGRRGATIYDAVAERIDYEGFINPEDAGATEEELENEPANRSRRGHPVAPEEALFRAQGAPDRYAENDIYAADQHLGPSQKLPDSDLLKAIHAYVSDFYSRATVDGGVNDMRSMDETALLAFGILLEEAAKDLLGSNGDMVLTEADTEALFADKYGGVGGGTAQEGMRDAEREQKRPRMEEDESQSTDGIPSAEDERSASTGL